MSRSPEFEGMAALTICESLLLALNDKNILPESEIMGVLVDAAAAHTNAPAGDGNEALHAGAASVIQRIIDSGNSVRRR